MCLELSLFWPLSRAHILIVPVLYVLYLREKHNGKSGFWTFESFNLMHLDTAVFSYLFNFKMKIFPILGILSDRKF